MNRGEAPSAQSIAFPDGKTLGDAANVKLRFDPTYTEMAAKGELGDTPSTTPSSATP